MTMNTMTNTTPNHTLTMSSIELAEVADKLHKNTRRTMETLAEQGVITCDQTERVHVGGNNRRYTTAVYYVNQRDSYVVMAQLSPQFTAALVDRWQELEKQVSEPKVPATYSEALRLAADLSDQNEKLGQDNARMNDELQNVTIAEYVALTHRYLTHGEKLRIGNRAQKISDQHGTGTYKVPRRLYVNGRARQTEVKVYERWTLEEAEAQLGLVYAHDMMAGLGD